MSVASWALALGLPVFAAWGVTDPLALMGVTYPEEGASSLFQQAVAAVLLAAPVTVVGFGLVRMAWLFNDQAAGLVFTRENANRIRTFGLCLFLGALLTPLAHTLAVLALTIGFPVGSRLLQVSLTSRDFILLSLGGGMAVLGWVMGEASRLAEDMDGIV
ncbi:DUF2975 domain-containing protein [Rhodospirillum sp. A1_3_36]|uniref:DUF2975 domain-containing protein n=1 Tax=Rhodospirillum sp. A1_3_36 TaxID=3391666 RepID=UPI0039A4FB43